MTVIDWAFDGVLAVTLIVLAVRILWVTSLFHAVVLFFCLGLLMALTWVRLAAPDVALAEAGIGAALTGVLLVILLHKLRWGGATYRTPLSVLYEKNPANSLSGSVVSGLIGAVILLLLLQVVAVSPRTGEGLVTEVLARMEASGVTHEVTAVLLDFRSLDTFLELTVLFVAVLAMLTLRQTEEPLSQIMLPPRRDVVVDWMWRLLLPLLVIVAGYLLWLGSFTSGGAFQSGIVLSATLILLSLTGQPTLEQLPELLWRALTICGLVTFAGVGAGMLLLGRSFMDYPPEWASTLILFLELMATVTIAMTLATLVLGLSVPIMFERNPKSS